MLKTDRDCRRGGQRLAIQTLAVLEGKFIASEIVATSCLHELSAHSGRKGMLSIKNRIRQALDGCRTNASLCHEATDATIVYALERLDAAAEAAGNQAGTTAKSGGCETVSRLRT